MPKEKALNIETLRGLAILLVVIGHVIGSAPDEGMKIDFPSPWRYIYLWIDYIQMPLFTAIAGWVYALKPIGTSRFGQFSKRKAMRLLIPMATVGSLYFLIQYFIPGTNNKGILSDIWRIYVFPYTIYWYLPSLFLIFLTMFGIDRYKKCESINNWILLITLAFGLYLTEKVLFQSIPNLFSFKGAINQFPYFIAGVGIQRFSRQLYNTTLNNTYILLATCGLILLQCKWYYSLNNTIWYETLLPIWIIACLILLLRQTHINYFLIWIGSYAYTIYLFHGFGTSGGRIILSYFGIHSNILIFMFATIIAVAGPIIVKTIIKQWKTTRILFLGTS